MSGGGGNDGPATDGGSGGGGGGGDADLAIDDRAIRRIVAGLKAVIGELEETGSAMTQSNRGAGIQNLALTSKEAGTGGLADDFETFCESWEWGVRGLMSEANDLAEKLDLAVGIHHANDQYWGKTFEYANHVLDPRNNPGLSPEEVQGQGTLIPQGSDPAPAQSTGPEPSWSNPEGTGKFFRPAENQPQTTFFLPAEGQGQGQGPDGDGDR